MKKKSARKNIVGGRVAKARRGSSPALTQDALSGKLAARGIQLDRAAIAKIENGLRHVLDYELKALARVLRVELNWLRRKSPDELPRAAESPGQVACRAKWVCPVCGYDSNYCYFHARNIEHPGECRKQPVVVLEHNHGHCKNGCEECIRGVVHHACNRYIAFIEANPQAHDRLLTPWLKNFLSRGAKK